MQRHKSEGRDCGYRALFKKGKGGHHLFGLARSEWSKANLSVFYTEELFSREGEKLKMQKSMRYLMEPKESWTLSRRGFSLEGEGRRRRMEENCCFLLLKPSPQCYSYFKTSPVVLASGRPIRVTHFSLPQQRSRARPWDLDQAKSLGGRACGLSWECDWK